MVSSVASGVPATRKCKSFFLGQMRLQVDSLANGQSKYDGHDFSDVFGPIAISMQASPQLPLTSKENALPTWNRSRILRVKDPDVVFSGSHSLAGPSPGFGLVKKINKLALKDTDRGPSGSILENLESVDPTFLVEPKNQLPLSSTEDLDDQASCEVKPNQCPGLEDFKLLKVVGQGAFGKVFQARRNGTSEIYALKVMRKDKIIKRNYADYVKTERDILTKIVHPFIVQLRYSFQTKYKLYLALDFVNGGDLLFQRCRQGLFSEDLARVYTAEIVSAVSHIHKNGIIHRDIKPENILLDAEGHIKLADFGLAKEIDPKTRSNSMCGTPEYMAPEIILAKGHDKSSDWWSIGIIVYEMLTGQPPFTHKNTQKTLQKIIKEKIKLPSFLTSEAHSLLKALLQKDPAKRLGSGVNGSDEIKQHKWFKSINWKKLEAKEIQPGFIPDVRGKCCVANFNECWTTMPPEDSPPSSPKCGEQYFKGYTYVAPNALHSIPDKPLPCFGDLNLC